LVQEQQAERQRTILIVDDDAEFRASVNGTLRRAGYRTVEAEHGAAALKALEAVGERIQLMIVDLCLPDKINGLDIIIEAAKRKIPAKIVAASGVWDEMHLEIAHQCGADLAIRKPLPAEVALWSLQTVESLLGAPVQPSGQRLVVVADDEDSVRRFVKSVLEHAGYQVLEAADGVNALALIEKIGGAVDLLVTDCTMPNLNGTGLVRAVREKYAGIPVVYMSGFTSDSDGTQLDDPSAQCAFIPKPFSPKAFLQLVHRMSAPAQKT
jgi:CheY-like chemotaxis protein